MTIKKFRGWVGGAVGQSERGKGEEGFDQPHTLMYSFRKTSSFDESFKNSVELFWRVPYDPENSFGCCPFFLRKSLTALNFDNHDESTPDRNNPLKRVVISSDAFFEEFW